MGLIFVPQYRDPSRVWCDLTAGFATVEAADQWLSAWKVAHRVHPKAPHIRTRVIGCRDDEEEALAEYEA